MHEILTDLVTLKMVDADYSLSEAMFDATDRNKSYYSGLNLTTPVL